MVNVKAMLASRMWRGLCTVIVRRMETNPVNKLSDYVESVLLADVPCHLSFERVTETGEASPAATVHQAAKLFLSSEHDVPVGSKIIVAQDGRTTAYQRSGLPAMYPSHQEIALVPFERWA